jgi:hypothetical protein
MLSAICLGSMSQSLSFTCYVLQPLTFWKIVEQPDVGYDHQLTFLCRQNFSTVASSFRDLIQPGAQAHMSESVLSRSRCEVLQPRPYCGNLPAFSSNLRPDTSLDTSPPSLVFGFGVGLCVIESRNQGRVFLLTRSDPTPVAT